MMYPKLCLNKKTKNKIPGVTIFIMFIILMPVLYFLVKASDGRSLNINPGKGAMTKQQFFTTIAPAAEQIYKQDKIFASITLAQAMLESSTGNSALTRKANNLFGIKAYNWTGKTIKMQTEEHNHGADVVTMGTFRSYDNWGESIEDHTNFLIENSTYKHHGVFKATNFTEQAESLQAAGYATDPDYAKELVTLIKEYNLDKYDSVK